MAELKSWDYEEGVAIVDTIDGEVEVKDVWCSDIGEYATLRFVENGSYVGDLDYPMEHYGEEDLADAVDEVLKNIC